MSQALDATLAMHGVNALDRARALTLGYTLRSRLLRSIYVRPELRLGAQFALAAWVSFLVSAWIPLLPLIAGPLVYGLPHLAASFRFGLPHLAASFRFGLPNAARRLAPALLAVCLITITARVFVHYAGVDLGGILLLPELLGMLAIFGLLALSAGASRTEALFSIGVFVPVLLLLGARPMEAALFMLFAHNAVAFVHWWLCRGDRAHRALVSGTAAVFALGSLALASGVHESWITPWYYVSADLSVFTHGPELLGAMNSDPQWIARLVSAFAFGQTLHYFVWLKAIPEAQSKTRTSAMSFRGFFARLGGSPSYRAVGLVMLSFAALPLACLAFRFAEVRVLYFAIASFHGYFEVAGLFFRK